MFDDGEQTVSRLCAGAAVLRPFPSVLGLSCSGLEGTCKQKGRSEEMVGPTLLPEIEIGCSANLPSLEID